ncbi:MAG: type II toxin-antitoxin system HicB family antitoxin [Patescibacteria group bacterium]
MNYDTSLRYTAYFQPTEEGGYVVTVPALPGCVSQGNTFEEARANIADAINGYLRILAEDGDEIPIEKEYVAAHVSVVSPKTFE